MKKSLKSKSPEELKKEVIISTLSQVKYAEKALHLWESLFNAYDKLPHEVSESFHKVQQFFIHKELESYRNLFMASTVFSSDDSVAAKEKALKRFLSKDSQVIHLWTPDGQSPGSWLAEDEETIRKIKKKSIK